MVASTTASKCLHFPCLSNPLVKMDLTQFAHSLLGSCSLVYYVSVFLLCCSLFVVATSASLLFFSYSKRVCMFMCCDTRKFVCCAPCRNERNDGFWMARLAHTQIARECGQRVVILVTCVFAFRFVCHLPTYYIYNKPSLRSLYALALHTLFLLWFSESRSLCNMDYYLCNIWTTLCMHADRMLSTLECRFLQCKENTHSSYVFEKHII